MGRPSSIPAAPVDAESAPLRPARRKYSEPAATFYSKSVKVRCPAAPKQRLRRSERSGFSAAADVDAQHGVRSPSDEHCLSRESQSTLMLPSEGDLASHRPPFPRHPPCLASRGFCRPASCSYPCPECSACFASDPPSLIPQRHYGIQAQRPACGHIAGEERHRTEQHGYRHKHRRIVGLHVE